MNSADIRTSALSNQPVVAATAGILFGGLRSIDFGNTVRSPTNKLAGQADVR
jgi:hypothetical protein